MPNLRRYLIILSVLIIISIAGYPQENKPPKPIVGVGIGLIIPNVLDNYDIQNSIPIFVFPIKYSFFKIEPEFGKHHREVNNWDYNYYDAINLGVAALVLKSYNHFTLEFGFRTGLIKNKRSSNVYWYLTDPTDRYIERYQCSYFAPDLGFEYNIVKHISIGSELQIRYIKQKTARDNFSEESIYQRVKLLIGVRFYL